MVDFALTSGIQIHGQDFQICFAIRYTYAPVFQQLFEA
jgi:hypothetical protein